MMEEIIMKKILTLVLALALIMSSTSALACTGFYVGKQASANGATVIGHTVDAWTTAQGVTLVVPGVENEPGRVYKVADGVEFPLPDTTYQYTTTPFIYGIWDGAVANEKGVAVTAAITCYVTEEIAEMDPTVENGLSEQFLCALVGMCASSAREGVEVLASYIDMFGNAEQNTILIADQNEAWYMETYTGHQWCAVKMPEDCVAVFGNEFMLGAIDPDSDDVMYSDGLFSMPEEAGLAVYTEDGQMDLFATYSGGVLKDGSNLRTWYGHVLFAPSTAGDYATETRYDLFYQPDEPITINQVFDMTRSRYEGTEYCPETKEDYAYDTRVIAIERQVNIGAIEVYDSLPAEMSCVTWVCTADAEHSVYLPVSNLVTDVAEAYKYIPEEGGPDDQLAHYCFKRLSALSKQNRAQYGQGVRDYWHSVEADLAAEYPTVLAETQALYETDPEAAAAYITEYTIGVQEKALADANQMFDELMWYVVSNTNTMLDPNSVDPFVPSLAVAEEDAEVDAAA